MIREEYKDYIISKLIEIREKQKTDQKKQDYYTAQIEILIDILSNLHIETCAHCGVQLTHNNYNDGINRHGYKICMDCETS